jgi:hypothetical protein
MKKLIILIAVLFTVSAQAEILFQKTYTVAGMKASEIEQAFGDRSMKKEDGVVNKIGFSLSLLSGSNATSKKTGKQEYPIKCNWMGSSFYADADIILQAKDDKFRVTVTNAIDGDSGKALIKMNPKFVKKCTAQIEQWADAKHEQVRSLAF